MKYRYKCGERLHTKELGHGGVVPFCESCHAYHFPIFNTTISMMILDLKRSKVLMVQQYGEPNNTLVAGYVNKEKCTEGAMIREMRGETGRGVLEHHSLRGEYFPKTNTLIFNSAMVIDGECLENVNTWGMDQAARFTFDEVRASVKPASLAQRFLLNFLSVYKQGTEHFFSHY